MPYSPKTNRSVFTFIAGLLLFANIASTAEFYVSNAGNDQTGDGSQDKPFKTINKAFEKAANNKQADTIYLRRGDTFKERIYSSMSGSEKHYPVTFRPYGKGNQRPTWHSEKDYALEVKYLQFTAEGIRFTGDRGVYIKSPNAKLIDCVMEASPGPNFLYWVKETAGGVVLEKISLPDGQRVETTQGGMNLLFDVKTPGLYRLTTRRGANDYSLQCTDGEVFEGDGTRTVFLAKGPRRIFVQSDYISNFKIAKIEKIDDPKSWETTRVSRCNFSRFLRLNEPLRLQLKTCSEQPVKATITVKQHKDGKTFLQKDVDVSGAKEISLPLGDEGQYDVSTTVAQKSLEGSPIKVVVMDPTPLPMPKTYQPLGPGKLVDEIDCAKVPDPSDGGYYDSGDAQVVQSPLGAYRQTGPSARSGTGGSEISSWFGYRLKIKNPGKLHSVVIDYPDDDFRSMLLLLYEHGRTYRQFDNGVTCGAIRRLSNRIRHRTIYYWPRKNIAWLVAHCFKAGAPGAIQRIRVYEHDGELPPLPVGNNGRYFGIYYEEPRFIDWSNETSDDPIEFVRTWARMGRYMRHVGQNLLWYPVLAYQVAAVETNMITSSKEYSDKFGRATFRGMLLSAEKHGHKIIAELHGYIPAIDKMIPEGIPLSDTRQIHRDGGMGSFARTRDSGYNFVHPAIQDILLKAFRRIAKTYKDSPAFLGIGMRGMQMMNPGFCNFQSMDWGYGDFTVGLFEKETGLRVPCDPKSPTRFQERYDWLMKNADVKKRWIAWRTEKVTAWLKRLTGMLREVRGDLCLYIWPKGGGFQRDPGRGMDPAQWEGIPNLVFTAHSWYGPQFCGYRFPLTKTQNIKPWEPAKHRYDHQGSKRAVTCFNPYMEAGKLWERYPDAMLGEMGKGGDTSAAPESPYPYYLERYADWVSTGAPWLVADGALTYQGVCTREKQIFAKFIRSLPMLDYQPAEMNLEPAFLWQANGEDANYFYLVNRQEYPVNVSITITDAKQITRLSDEKCFDIENGKLSLALEPFAMTAFRLPKEAAIANGQVKVPPKEIAALKRQIEQARQIVDAALKLQQDGKFPTQKTETGIDALPRAEKELEAAEKAFAEKRYDTADRHVRGYLPSESPDESGYCLPMVYEAMNRWPIGMFNDIIR
ncbi:MAG: DUF4398 domain-containing protein [Phycisphaerae bacterium]|nr:DUF4398 domain-containing protein [Phycisphaerae bacterium]